MARTGTVHHLRVDLSDVDRGVYEALDLRLSHHPSETYRRVLTKTLAYALLYEEGLEFARAGLSDTDEPEMATRDVMGIVQWIEVGAPAADRLKRATNASRKVVVVCADEGRAVEGVLERARALPRADRVTVFSIDARFVDALGEKLGLGSGRFELVRSGAELYATCGGASLQAPLVVHDLGSA